MHGRMTRGRVPVSPETERVDEEVSAVRYASHTAETPCMYRMRLRNWARCPRFLALPMHAGATTVGEARGG